MLTGSGIDPCPPTRREEPMSTNPSRTPTARTRRLGQASALVAAPVTFLVANLGDVLTKTSGVDDTTARGALEISAAHPWLTPCCRASRCSAAC